MTYRDSNSIEDGLERGETETVWCHNSRCDHRGPLISPKAPRPGMLLDETSHRPHGCRALAYFCPMRLVAGIALLALATLVWHWNEHLSLACALLGAVALWRGGVGSRRVLTFPITPSQNRLGQSSLGPGTCCRPSLSAGSAHAGDVGRARVGLRFWTPTTFRRIMFGLRPLTSRLPSGGSTQHSNWPVGCSTPTFRPFCETPLASLNRLDK